MSSREQLQAMDYGQIEYEVREVIRRWKVRNTGQHRSMAAVHEDLWKIHQPVPRDETSDCLKCGVQWPCEVVAGMTVGS
jgi:hypothetical protein